MNLLRVLIVGVFFLSGLGGSACRYSPTHSNISNVDQWPLPTPTDADPNLKTCSEIELRRIHSGCINCDDHSLVLRRGAGDIFADASVIRTDLHTEKRRTGTLSAYYYNHLIQLAKSQGIFDMDDQHAMGWVDSLIVTLNVSIGDRRKTIHTSSEGRVPLKLWGFYMAIDGAVARTKWSDAK